MASPFPGMDPYLEGEMWQEFHETLAGAIRGQLVGYERLLDYTSPPPPPPLDTTASEWIASCLEVVGLH